MQYPEKGESQQPQGKFLLRPKESHRVIVGDDPVNRIDPTGHDDYPPDIFGNATSSASVLWPSPDVGIKLWSLNYNIANRGAGGGPA